MPVTQLYETTLVDTERDLSAKFAIVPARSIPNFEGRSREDLLETLELETIVSLQAGRLAIPLAYALAAQDLEEFYYDGLYEGLQEGYPYTTPPSFDEDYLQFAEYLTYARVLPFENSPLSVESFGSIGTTEGIGATIGYVVAGPTPWLFVTVPAGIVVCTAASEFGRGLGRNLTDLISVSNEN